MTPTPTESPRRLETPAANPTAPPPRKVEAPRKFETTPEDLDEVARAIRSDAFRDPLAYVLRSDTQQHGE